MSGRVCVFGSFNVDIVAKVSRFPRGGESLMALGSSVGPGGKGTNQATAASKAGAYVHFVSKVGKDQFSRMASEHLTLSEIDSFNLYQSDTEPTGSAIIYVSQDDGENMIAIYSGANITVTDAEVQGIFPALKKSDILFFSILIKRISVISLVTYSAIFFVLRNILLLLSGSVSMVLFSQSFQAFSFALFIPASAYFMHQFTMPADNVRAQTILSIAMTSGGVLGSIMGGVLLEFIDINRILFLSLFVVSGGLWLIIKGLRSKKLYNGGESQRII